jgi:hypothetical protein
MIGADPHGAPIDASGYTPPDALNAYAQTGMRPVSKRQFKRGGALKAEGAEGKMHAGRKPRKAGGKAMPPIDAMLNRDVKIADAYRDGGNEHVGGMKKGGRAHKMGGGPLNTAFMGGELMHRARGGAAHTDEAQDRVLIHKMIKPKALTGKAHGGEIHHKMCRCERCMGGKARSVSDGEMQGTRPTGDRLARKDGGRAKGKTNINIIIGAPPQAANTKTTGTKNNNFFIIYSHLKFIDHNPPLVANP